MKVCLMFRDRNFQPDDPIPANADDLVKDLELDILLDAMAGDDKTIRKIARASLLSGLTDTEAILYRQDTLRDCIALPTVVRELYSISVDAIEKKRRDWYGIYRSNPGTILHSAAHMIEMYMPYLRRLKQIASESRIKFSSESFRQFFSILEYELDDLYLDRVRDHLKYLSFKEGVLISARLGHGADLIDHVLRKSKRFGRTWLQSVLTKRSQTFSFSISPRDDAGCRALSELKDRGVNPAADALARAADHIESFFNRLVSELAFYIGCLNLADRLSALSEPICFPEPHATGSLHCEYTGLYNPCLSLHTGARSIGNSVNARGRNPVLITGVNEGGKSTFLRSVGVAQLMMQSGMFVSAVAFSADIAYSIHTHYRRHEDRNMTSGKLDEELARMDVIAGRISAGALILFNESFSATNEREGADIAGQITKALVDRDVRVYFVTHLYSFAALFFSEDGTRAHFLKAERSIGNDRRFQLVEGAPSPKSYGEDLYRKVFEGVSKPSL